MFLRKDKQVGVGKLGLCCSKDRAKVESAQREELKKILTEFEDIAPDNVTLLIRYIPKQYIVFLDGDSEVDFETTDAYDSEHSQHKEQLDMVYSRIEELEHRPAVQYLSPKHQKTFVRLLGNAVAAELSMAETVAGQTLQVAEQFLKQRTTEISRCWLLLSSFGVFVSSWVLWKLHFRQDFMLFGCLGAFFSILCKTGKLEYDCEAGVFLNVLEILSRFVAAAISAFLAEQLFKADLFFTALKTTPGVLPLIYFVAGFSERLVPSIVTTLGEKEKTEEKGL